MTIEEYMKAIRYRITGGDDYCWNSFGRNARWLNSDDLDHYGSSIVYDTENQTVYSAEVHDYGNRRSYRWTNPAYIEAYQTEAKQKKVDADEAYDDVKYTDLESVEDFLNKCSAIVDGRPYDTRVSIPIDLEDDELFQLMKLAHERDITLNQLVEQILTEVINRHQNSSSVTA